MSKSLKVLINKYPKKKVQALDGVYFIDGEVLVSIDFLTKLYDIHRNQIPIWIKKGLQPHRLSLAKMMLFNPADVILWHKANMSSRSKSSRKVDSGQHDEDETQLDLKDVSKDEADRRLQIQKVLNEEIKHKELIGKLIPAEDTDKVLAEIGAIHVAQYRGDLKLLPMLLENKPKHEITKLLDEHYESRIEDMYKIVNVKGHEVTIFERSQNEN